MKKFNQETIKNLSFEDFDVEKMEFSSEIKELKIFVQGACLIVDKHKVRKLGKGLVVFNDWELILIKKGNSEVLEGLPEGYLKCLSEVIFSDSIVYLAGKGLKEWIEWIIFKPKISAEFEEYQEEDY